MTMTAVHVPAEIWPPTEGGCVVDARVLEGDEGLARSWAAS